MWLTYALLSALSLGFYDVFKKASLKNNAVIPVLWFNTLFCSLLMLPLAILSTTGNLPDSSLFYIPNGDLNMQLQVLLKSAIVLGSWIFGYFGMKHLPLTIVGPVNATRPIIVLIGGLILFSERLNIYQWIGVVIAMMSFYLLSRSGKKEGIDFRHNKWILCVVMATLLGAISGLYDKYLMGSRSNMFVQAWSNFYQLLLMSVILFTLWWPKRQETTPFRWKWSIIFISIFLSAGDYTYFFALTSSESMISIMSMIRRSSVIVSFLFGAMFFHEKNLRSKAIDLILVLIGLTFLLIGTIQN